MALLEEVMKIILGTIKNKKTVLFISLFISYYFYRDQSFLRHLLWIIMFDLAEELRLKVPADLKEVWLQAEKNVWEPWLSSKMGF